jgi:hypothetical protein
MHVKCPADFFLLDLIILIFGEEYTLYMTFEIFTVVKIFVTFWVMMLCSTIEHTGLKHPQSVLFPLDYSNSSSITQLDIL